ncbi:MAG: hypothetical protein M3N47_14315 [Chloroflexota bacterium]|nr:hypothetical protein [Chloroflexota bacterium]
MKAAQRLQELAPAELLELSLHNERGAMVIDDLRRRPTSPLIVAEGSPLPPAGVSSGVAERSRAVWLLPTPEFQRAQLEKRELPRGPRELYLLLAAEVAREAREHAVPILAVDGSQDISETVVAVERLFAEALAEGPRAETLDKRRALLREANMAIVSQVRGYFSRPWADGEGDVVVREFVCECAIVPARRAYVSLLALSPRRPRSLPATTDEQIPLQQSVVAPSASRSSTGWRSRTYSSSMAPGRRPTGERQPGRSGDRPRRCSASGNGRRR